jgi:hypothetical protein
MHLKWNLSLLSELMCVSTRRTSSVRILGPKQFVRMGLVVPSILVKLDVVSGQVSLVSRLVEKDGGRRSRVVICAV